MKNKKTIAIILTVFMVVSLCGLTACSKKEEPPIEVGVADIIDAYTTNEVGADTTYKDKNIQVTGVVASIGTDITNTVYITMDKGGDWDINAIQFYFEDSDQVTKVGTLKEGDTITVKGKCTGFSIFNVMVKDCEIVE